MLLMLITYLMFINFSNYHEGNFLFAQSTHCLHHTQVSAVAWLSMVMSAFLGLLAMTIVFTSFYVMRTWTYWLTVGVSVY